MEDSALVWTLLAYGLEAAPQLRRDILGHQDTHMLYLWRVHAATLIEEITDVLEARSGDDHFPTEGMR